MSQFLHAQIMSISAFLTGYGRTKAIFLLLTGLFLSGCTTPAQDRTENSLRELNNQSLTTKPYLGGYSSTEPPRLSADEGYDPLSPELSETVAVPFLSFLIIEPDPISKNAVPPDLERLIKARKFQDAIRLIDNKIKVNPKNVQIQFIKARLQLELREWDNAKKTLIGITQQFPELPEPYNNLAAIAANQGHWIEARDYLELALKIRPSYAIGAANLGEIYIRLGAQAYTNAAKGAQVNSRQYANRAKALLDILKPPKKAKPRSDASNDRSDNSSNPSNYGSKNDNSPSKNQ